MPSSQLSATSYLGCFQNVARFANDTGGRLTACVSVENGSVEAAVAWVQYAQQEKLGVSPEHWWMVQPGQAGRIRRSRPPTARERMLELSARTAAVLALLP